MQVFNSSSVIKLLLSVFIISASILMGQSAYAEQYNSYSNEPITVDSRLKTFVYNENEVFPVVLQFGYQTNIEFSKEETIQVYSLGNNFAWQISSKGRLILLRPLEEGIMTNMIVRTNKRVYYFELISRPLSEGASQEVAYAIRFFYPNNKDKLGLRANRVIDDAIPGGSTESPTMSDSLQDADTKGDSYASSAKAPKIEPYNFDYTIKGDKIVKPDVAFDDGINTYFQYNRGLHARYKVVLLDSESELESRIIGNYLVVGKVGKRFSISLTKDRVFSASVIRH